VTESVSEDQRHAVTFAFLHSSQMLYPFPTIHLRGLKTEAMYRIEALDGKLSNNLPAVASGAFWMGHGVDVELRGDFQAAAFTFEMVER
jgi:alpha-galactosidase